jgi:hypothetical protein
MYYDIYDSFVSTVESPIIIIEYQTFQPNSAGGVSCMVRWTNIGEKDIKYVTFTVTPYNRVNDIVASTIGNQSTAKLQVTGPYPINKEWENIRANTWENVWYNSTIDHMRLDGIEITYMDNSIETISKEKITSIIFPTRMKDKASAAYGSYQTLLPYSSTVRELQTLLTEKGFYNGPINGDDKDRATINAANDARKHFGLPNPLNGLNDRLIYFLKNED